MSHICDISPLRGLECVPSIMKLLLVIGVRHKPMNVAKNVDGFSAALWPKYRLQGEF